MSKLIEKIRLLVARTSAALAWLPPLATRVVIGVVFLQSGWGKLHNLEHVIGYFRELGVPAPELQAPFVAATEFGCGLLLLLGLATPIAALPLIGVMVVAIVTAKREEIKEFTDLFSLSEFLNILLLGWLCAFGAGPVSLDAWLRRKFRLQSSP